VSRQQRRAAERAARKRGAPEPEALRLIERQHAQSCRALFGLLCTCTPIYVEVGRASTADEMQALLRASAARRDAIKAEIEKAFS
jgi:hypothetical protein